MIAAALLILAQAAPVTAAQDATPTPDIVIRGRRTEAALAACLATRCDAREDMRLSMAHAEALFAAGRYPDAHTALWNSIRRNRGAAARLPRNLAALYEASATVNLHRGDGDARRRGITGQARTLRENLPADDPDVLLISVRLADFRASEGRHREARHLYDDAARRYRALGQERLAAFVDLRAAGLAIAMRDTRRAQALLDGIAALPVAAEPAVARNRAVIAARLAAERGDDGAIDALVALLRANPQAGVPQLVEEGPKTELAEYRDRLDAVGGIPHPGRRLWVDIGYFVTADGTVADAEILRGVQPQGWARDELRRIAGRRYAPLVPPPGEPGVYRIERLTIRNEIIGGTGSMIRLPVGPRRIVSLDLTRDAPPAD